MASFWVRSMNRRGRRLYLLVASILFLFSVMLLLLRSWNTWVPQRYTDYQGVQSDVHYLRSSFLEEAHKEMMAKSNHEAAREGLAWFVQISDIHLQMGANDEVQQFQEFVDDATNIIKPAAVLATGDITNSKTLGVKLAELPEEWSIYKRSVKDRLDANTSVLWLDITGNHDNFDEVHQSHFKAYGVKVDFDISGTAKGRTVGSHGGSQNITLLPVDASLKPGIRAYNFLGYLPDEEFKMLRRAAGDAISRGDLVLFYGHYPTSTIVSSRDMRELLAMGMAYVCGHLHSGFGLAHQMWTRHSSGLMELELADWYHNHRYRILSIDNGQLMWLDVTHPVWPVVMISSIQRFSRGPSSTRFIVRFLVFSNEEISAVSVRIDDNLGHWIFCKHIYGPLYSATIDIQDEPWEQKKSEQDLVRNLQVLVGNSSGSKSLLRIGMDGSGFDQPDPSYFGTILLSMKLHDAFLLVYVSGVGMCCGLLMLAKYQVACEPLIPKKVMAAAISLSHNSPAFTLIMVFLLYPFLGPWYLGRLAGDKYGAVFMWGIFVETSLLPGELTYPDAFFLWITLQLPVFLIVLCRKLYSFDPARHYCMHSLQACLAGILFLQVPSILAWLVLDSILLNGPLRLGLSAVAVSLWRKI